MKLSDVKQVSDLKTMSSEDLASLAQDVRETILQTGRPQLPKALLVGDSYTNAVETLLYASFDETRALDLRHYSGQTLWDYLEKYRPQVVILLRDESVFIEESPNGTYR